MSEQLSAVCFQLETDSSQAEDRSEYDMKKRTSRGSSPE